MRIDIDVQQGCANTTDIPSEQTLHDWVIHTLQYPLVTKPKRYHAHVELSIRIVEKTESQQLNWQYRQQDKPTNVLSFPAEIPDCIPVPLLGDLVICAPVVIEEAQQQHKNLTAHWAHMVIHGTLHLLGYDHIKNTDAQRMEAIEVKLLTALGFPSPYKNDE